MAISADDLIIAIKILADTKDTVRNVNQATAAVNNFIKAAERAKATAKLTGTVPIISQGQIDQVKKLKTALDQADASAHKTGKGLITFANFARTAFGTLVAIGLFNILTGIVTFFKNTLTAASTFPWKDG